MVSVVPVGRGALATVGGETRDQSCIWSGVGRVWDRAGRVSKDNAENRRLVFENGIHTGVGGDNHFLVEVFLEE